MSWPLLSLQGAVAHGPSTLTIKPLQLPGTVNKSNVQVAPLQLCRALLCVAAPSRLLPVLWRVFVCMPRAATTWQSCGHGVCCRVLRQVLRHVSYVPCACY